MAEATKERHEAQRAADRTYQRAEDAMGTFYETGRRTLQSMIELNRNSMRTGYEFSRTMQEESLRWTDAWIDNLTRLQKSYLKSFHDCNNRMQEFVEKTARENNDRMEQSLDQGMEMMAPAGGRR